MNRIRILIPVILCAMILCSFGAEETGTYRIIGLCSPDRQEDLREVVSAIPEVQLVSIDYEKAEASFRYDPAKLLPAAKAPKDLTPEKVTERIGTMIREKSKGTFTIAAPSRLTAEQLTRLEIKFGILDCKGCRYGVYIAVAKIEGVERATVDSAARTLTAWIDPAKTNRAAIEEALKKARVELPAAGSGEP